MYNHGYNKYIILYNNIIILYVYNLICILLYIIYINV